MTPEQRHRQGVAERDGLTCWIEDETCSGRTQADHLIPRQTLARLHRLAHPTRSSYVPPIARGMIGIPVDVLISDPRNGRMLCSARHHLRKDLLTRDDLPGEFFEFVEQFGLAWWLDEHYPEGNG